MKKLKELDLVKLILLTYFLRINTFRILPNYNKNNLLHDENKLQLYTLENMVIFFVLVTLKVQNS